MNDIKHIHHQNLQFSMDTDREGVLPLLRLEAANLQLPKSPGLSLQHPLTVGPWVVYTFPPPICARGGIHPTTTYKSNVRGQGWWLVEMQLPV
jgi:hypothetical protein